MRPKTRSVEPTIRRGFDVEAYLESTGPARKVVSYRRGEVLFSQGDPGNDIRYIQKGAVKLSVLSRPGKEAVVALLAPGDFFGERALAGHSVRFETATAVVASTVLIIEKEAMVRLLQGTHPRVPTIQEAGAILWDPNIGLLVHAPLPVLALVAALLAVGVRARRRLNEREVWLGVAPGTRSSERAPGLGIQNPPGLIYQSTHPVQANSPPRLGCRHRLPRVAFTIAVHAFALQPFQDTADQGARAARQSQAAGERALHELQIRRRGLLAATILIIGFLVTLWFKIRTMHLA